MLNNNRTVEIMVDGIYLDLGDSTTIDINLNKNFFDVENPLSSTVAEYSYSFSVPSTRHNNKVFNLANVMSRKSKFARRFECSVYADSDEIFKGNLIINSYNGNQYNCNLVIAKNKNITDLFGEAKMTELDWKIPFDGTSSINEINANEDSKVFFPLVCYGAFQKTASEKTENYNYYTSLHSLDTYWRAYVETFLPSMNVMELVKRCFEYKNITVQGDAFSDEYLSKIYCSTSLASEQQTKYNLGNPKFGKMSVKSTFNTETSWNTNMGGTYQMLNYQYFPNKTYTSTMMDYQYNQDETLEWNFDTVCVRNILDTSDFSTNTKTMDTSSYLYQEDENFVVIPSSGWYKIHLKSNLNLSTSRTKTGNVSEYRWGSTANINQDWDFRETAWTEIQVLKNYDEDAELIRGRNCKIYNLGDTTKDAYMYYSCYPHEKLYGSYPVTKGPESFLEIGYYGYNMGSMFQDLYDISRHYSGVYKGKFNSTFPYYGTTSDFHTDDYYGGLGYIQCTPYSTHAYDPRVNSKFICGLSSFGGCASVIKNGYGCDVKNTTKIDSMSTTMEYALHKNQSDGGDITSTHVNEDALSGSYNYCSTTKTSMQGQVECIVWLEKDDVVAPYLISRCYEVADTNVNSDEYSTPSMSGNIEFSVEAFSDSSRDKLKEKNVGWKTPSLLDKDLQLGNFLNKEENMNEFVQNVIDEFGLDAYFTKDGTFTINKSTNNEEGKTKKPLAINLDDRINSYSANLSIDRINYPKSVVIKYAIDDSEAGFDLSVPSMYDEYPNWKDYADRGYDKIVFDNDSNGNEVTKDLKTSYCWYDNGFVFSYWDLDTPFTIKTLTLPLIAKTEYFIDGGNYDEYMKHDGLSLKRRYWFRDNQAQEVDGKPIKTVIYGTGVFNPLTHTWEDSATRKREYVILYVPKDNYNGLYLSYKENENSLLNNYFNIPRNRQSNYVTVECYILPQEYKLLKRGANVIVDDDIYKVISVQGYDPSGSKTATLRLMKY